MFLRSSYTDLLVVLVLTCWYRARVRESSFDIFRGRPVGAAEMFSLNSFTMCVILCLRFSRSKSFIQTAPNEGAVCILAYIHKERVS